MEPHKLIAVVEMNGGEALVLDRPVDTKWKRLGRDYHGRDGVFCSLLSYSPATPGMRAFGGSKLTLHMEDGTTEPVQDHWWDSHYPGNKGIAVNSVDGLRKCYVFTGAEIAPDDLEALRMTYTGPVYGYWEYEKILKEQSK